MERQDDVRLDGALTARVDEYAKASGVTFQEALETALGLGLELCTAETVRTIDRLARLEAIVGEMAIAVDAIGAATMGTRALLVGWAAKEALGVSEDELMAELEATGRGEWDFARTAGATSEATEPTRASEE